MLSSKHCKNRVERLRLSLLVTSHRAAAARLRNVIERYRLLADRARETEHAPVDQAHAAIRQLAELVLRSSLSESKVVFRPLRIDAPRQRQPNISAAKQAPARPPTSELERHLERTIRYYRQQIPLSHSGSSLIH